MSIENRLPEAYLQRMRRELGEEADAYEASFCEKPFYGIRANTARFRVEDMKRTFPGQLTPVPWAPEGCYYPAELRPARHPYYYAGLYYLQEPSAMSPGSVLPIVPGDRVLDLCGAPGGKATQLGMRLMGSGVLFANDISASRAQAMLKNIELAGIPNVYVTAETPEHLAENFPEYFDKILVDAPCSGEGMFRREPSMVKDWEAKGPAYYADIQQQILRTAVRMLRPGGMLLYSTCTFSEEEDEENVRKLLAQDPALSLVPIAPRPGFSDGKIPGTVKLWPHKVHGEGHFLSLFQKAGSSDSKESAASKSAKRSASKPGRLPEEAAAFLARLPEKYRKLTSLQVKENIYLLPEDTALRPGLHYLRTGLFFGTLKKEHFTPSQALALALSAEDFSGKVLYPLEDERVIRYLKGETIDTSGAEEDGPDGWNLVCVDRYPLGWAKRSKHNLKNKYCPGWRWQ